AIVEVRARHQPRDRKDARPHRATVAARDRRRGDRMKRREFISLIGSAAAWPLAARAQQGERVRRIGSLHDYNEFDPEGRVQVVAFREALEKLGWTDGRNALIEYRSGAADNELLRKYAAEIVAHEPDVVLTSGATITAALQRVSHSVPIVFVSVTDPVGAGLVASLARPEGNASGFTQFEFGISAKWLELLKEIAPTVTRVVVIRDPTAHRRGTIGCHPGGSAVARGRREASRPAQSRRHRARPQRNSARGEGRPCRDVKQAGACASRTDCYLGGPPPSACDLCFPSLCRRRRAVF